MGLKSTNVQRSAERLREGKVAVLEHNASDVTPNASPQRTEKSSARLGDPSAPPPPAVPPAPAAPSSPGAPSSPAADDVEALYIEHRNLLLYVACRKFRIPDPDAENLIQEVFSRSCNGTKIENVRACSWRPCATPPPLLARPGADRIATTTSRNIAIRARRVADHSPCA